MGRLLLILIAVIAVVLIARFLLTRRRVTPRPTVYTATVRCARCGTHLPRDQALARGDRYYCCAEHLKANEESRSG